MKDSFQSLGVLRRTSDEEIDVFCESRITMESDGVTANDEEVNFRREAQCDKVGEIFLNLEFWDRASGLA